MTGGFDLTNWKRTKEWRRESHAFFWGTLTKGKTDKVSLVGRYHRHLIEIDCSMAVLGGPATAYSAESGGKPIHWPCIQRQSVFYGSGRHNYLCQQRQEGNWPNKPVLFETLLVNVTKITRLAIPGFRPMHALHGKQVFSTSSDVTRALISRKILTSLDEKNLFSWSARIGP